MCAPGESNLPTADADAKFDLGAADPQLIRQAIGRYERELAAARQRSDRAGEARILSRLGLASAALGEAGQAIAYHEQALEIVRKMGDRRGEGQQLNNLADAYCRLGDNERAQELLQRSVTCLHEVGARREEADTLTNLSAVCELLGDKPQAAACLGEALLIWGQLDPPRARQARRKLQDLQAHETD